MSLKRLTATFGLLAALAAAELPPAGQALAMQAGFQAGADTDTLTLSGDGGPLPRYSVRRTGAQELTVTFEGADKAPAPPSVGGSKLVSGVRQVPGGLKISLKTSAFGYVNFPVAGKTGLQIQIFPDAVGAGWTPAAKPDKPDKPEKTDAKAEAAKRAEAEKARVEAEKAKAEEAARKKAEAQARREQEAQARRDRQEEAKREQEAKARAAAEAKAAKAAPPAPQTPPAAAPAGTAPAATAPAAKPQGDAAQGGQPYFSVPYSMRAPVNKTVLGTSAPLATLPPVVGQPSQPAAPLAKAEAPAPALPQGQKGGKVPPGVVEKPILQESTAKPQEQPAPPPAPAPGRAPTDVPLPRGGSEVRFRAERRGPAEARPAEVLGAEAGKPIATPPPATSSAPPPAASTAPAAPPQAAPAAAAKGEAQAPSTPAPKAEAPLAAAPAAPAQPAARPWELRQPVQKVLLGAGGSGATLPPVAEASQSAPAAPGHEAAPAANASAHGPEPTSNATGAGHAAANASAPDTHAPAKQGGKDAHGGGGKEGGKDKKQEGPLSVEQLKDQLLKAQSDMVAGKWAEAQKGLEEIMREPALKGDLREEVLYALADTYMQSYKDSLAANYDKVAGAQLTAMNANQKSMRVPRALVNLGLLNLKVGNLAEAKAYFNVVKKKYAHDQNASIIPFSLGEYYRAKGDLPRAAEQYQTLIQSYPDSRLAKETAYLLAQTLRKLGNNEKAAQIVDYLDKRWPLYYMENPAFLKLQAEAEEKVGKLAPAKDHYWTFYNLNPDNEYADILLVRIGDIYLRQGKRPAAKEVYQKALRDFPDREGGLVARMRIAEEGVYDDPTMSEMAGVFGKPEALKPNETYEFIITKHADSPLAPLALIKLGMWQFHGKSYMEAMGTAAGFLQKHPKSALVGKANELGFQAYLMALPGLVQDGNYQKVLQLYETSPFVKDNHDKIGDEAQMAIAVSAWKTGKPDLALKLAGRFLGKKQVPRYSEMALDLAMNIFMERKEWKRIADLATRAGAAWKLSPRQKAQFERAKAMALENQGDSEKSMPLWTRIASDTSADPATRAYATYVLAKDASRRQDMVRLFALAQEALTQLLANGGDQDKIKDCLLMTITATERSGRYGETLKWAKEFDRIIPDSDPDWAPMRLRLADIYRRGGQTAEWKTLLEDVVKRKPNTVYSRMASQALESSALDQRLQNYLTKGQR